MGTLYIQRENRHDMRFPVTVDAYDDSQIDMAREDVKAMRKADAAEEDGPLYYLYFSRRECAEWVEDRDKTEEDEWQEWYNGEVLGGYYR